MYNQPKISVAIPAYNEQENIALLLMQVINQKGNFNLEQIVVLTDGVQIKLQI
jgi:glycosyltransferase involved in cell wall biosynthesis